MNQAVKHSWMFPLSLIDLFEPTGDSDHVYAIFPVERRKNQERERSEHKRFIIIGELENPSILRSGTESPALI